MTSTALYTFCKETIANIESVFASKSDYEDEHKLLKDRHDLASTISGTQKLHHFKPISSSTVLIKRFSNSEIFHVKKICDVVQLLEEEHINGYVTVVYDGAWWLGYVVDKDTEQNTVKVSFLSPKGPSTSFKYPEQQDMLDVPYCDILTAVNVSTQTGRIYVLEEAEQKKATCTLQMK